MNWVRHLTADSASMKDLVPDRAMVPRLFTRSAFVMPMPLSWIASVLLDLSCDQADGTRPGQHPSAQNSLLSKTRVLCTASCRDMTESRQFTAHQQSVCTAGPRANMDQALNLEHYDAC